MAGTAGLGISHRSSAINKCCHGGPGTPMPFTPAIVASQSGPELQQKTTTTASCSAMEVWRRASFDRGALHEARFPVLAPWCVPGSQDGLPVALTSFRRFFRGSKTPIIDMGPPSTHTQDAPNLTFLNPALTLVVLMTYDSIIKPPVTELGRSLDSPCQQARGRGSLPARMHFAAHIAKRMDSDTHRRQLIYELLREVD
jgi:hypothetical protein